MRINFNPGLNIKTMNKPAIKASAEQLADAGKMVWKSLVKNKQAMNDSYIPLEMPKKYTNGEELVKWTAAKKGDFFKKGFFGVYKLNEKGKEAMKRILANMNLSENASLESLIFRTIRKFNGIR